MRTRIMASTLPQAARTKQQGVGFLTSRLSIGWRLSRGS